MSSCYEKEETSELRPVDVFSFRQDVYQETAVTQFHRRHTPTPLINITEARGVSLKMLVRDDLTEAFICVNGTMQASNRKIHFHLGPPLPHAPLRSTCLLCTQADKRQSRRGCPQTPGCIISKIVGFISRAASQTLPLFSQPDGYLHISSIV